VLGAVPAAALIAQSDRNRKWAPEAC